MIDITYQGMTLDQLRKEFDPRQVDMAMRRTLNRVLASVNTAMNKQARKIYTVRAKDINDIKKIHKAGLTDQDAVLTYIGSRLPLRIFKPRSRKVRVQTKRGKATRRRVTVRIRKDKGRVPVTSIPAFLTPSGYVMVRKTEKREPIRHAMTISVPEMMETQDQQAVFQNTVKERFPTEFEHQMDYYLGRTA